MTAIALYLVATPIGNPADLSPRAQMILRQAKLVIGEEYRPLTTLLKSLGRERTPGDSETLDVLNEHSKPSDILSLADQIEALQRKDPTAFAALISDCGTPGFCDPGAPLVAELRSRGYRVSAVPGASSLMCLLSTAGIELREFVFVGFLPAEKNLRATHLRALPRERRAQVLMDTPYRLMRLLDELAEILPDRRATLGCRFTCDDEEIFVDSLSGLRNLWAAQADDRRKAEFMLLIHAVE